MQDRTKLGAAVISGYILGRTKKGGLALRTAMWISGNPEVVAKGRSAVTGVLATEEAKAISEQVSGPLREAVQQAALRAVLGRVTALSDGLASRTQRLAEGTVSSTVETVDDATGELTGLLGNKGGEDEQEEPDTDEPDDEDSDDGEEHDEPSGEEGESGQPEDRPDDSKPRRRGRRAKSDA